MLLSLILNLSMTGAVQPLGYYPFECAETFVIIEKESTECETTTLNSLNTNNKIILNSLNNCS